MQQGLSDELYDHVRSAHTTDGFTERERLAVEVAERFALDHRAMDDDVFARLREQFSDPEILELVVTCGFCIGIGRVLQVLEVERDFDVLWSREPGGGPRRPAETRNP